jgi:RHS repeat-associated protein
VRFDLRFPGQQYDAATGLHYNYFRDYEPETGRYVESDPIGLRGGVSTYVYAHTRPLYTSDRSGLAASIKFFDEDKKKEIEAAIELAKETLKKCTSCHDCGKSVLEGLLH